MNLKLKIRMSRYFFRFYKGKNDHANYNPRGIPDIKNVNRLIITLFWIEFAFYKII